MNPLCLWERGDVCADDHNEMQPSVHRMPVLWVALLTLAFQVTVVGTV